MPASEALPPSLLRAARVAVKATELLSRQLSTSLVASPAVALLFAVAMREVVNGPLLVAWLVGAGAINVWRAVGRRRFLAASEEDRLAGVARWYRAALTGSGVAGTWWGLGFWLARDGSSAQRSFSVVLGAGLTAGALSSSVGSRDAFRLFALPLLLGLALSVGQTAHTELDWMVLFSLALFIPTVLRASGEVTARVLDNFELLEVQRATLIELEETRDSAVAAARARTDFLSVMSHEIRTPLNGVLGMATLMKDTPLNPEQRENLDTISCSAEALSSLVNDILDLSKIDAGRLQLDPADVGLRVELTRLSRLFRSRAEEKGLEFRLVLAPELPDRVRLDWPRLRQICVNLLGNALKFTERGAVTFRADVEAEWLRVSVTDTGIGMTAEARERLFEPFMQAHRGIHRQYGGTGLGLSISRRLAQLLGGDIEVTSEMDRGSTFAVRVRLEAAMEPEPLPRDAAAQKSLSPARVLVADDNDVNLRITRKLLERAGHLVVTVVDGQQALDALLGGAFHVAVLDMEMPHLSGVEVVRKARAAGVATPLVALTANASVEDRRECTRVGFDDFLTKPVSATALVAAVERWRSDLGDAAA